MFNRFKKCLLGLAFVAGVGSAAAGPYSQVVFFGDSLSDTGNVLTLGGLFGIPPFPAFPGGEGRFSNGPSWVETLAAGLGRPQDAAPSNVIFDGTDVIPFGPPGNNFAYGGARTGLGGSFGATTGLFGQLIGWNGSLFDFSTGPTRAADPDALYVIMAGANDLRDARSANPGNTPADASARAAAAGDVAQNIASLAFELFGAGARHFLFSNLPDLGKTPEAAALGVVDASSDITQDFNADIAQVSSFFDVFFDLDVHLLDLHGMTEAVIDDATNNGGARFGITNVTQACITPDPNRVGDNAFTHFSPDATGNDCEHALFSDPLHPTAAAHKLIGELALRTLLPVPASLWLLVLPVAFTLRRAARR